MFVLYSVSLCVCVVSLHLCFYGIRVLRLRWVSAYILTYVLSKWKELPILYLCCCLKI